jgi:hypothetical protein
MSASASPPLTFRALARADLPDGPALLMVRARKDLGEVGA